MRRIIIALAVGTLVIASSLSLRAQDAATSAPASADGEKIKSLVKALSSDDFKVREQAQKDLTAIGIPAKAEIADAMKSEDSEVKQRAEQIMAAIVKEEQAARDALATKNYLWGFAITNGMSEGPIVAGNMVLAAGLDGRVYAIDAKTGKQVWVTADVPVAKLKPGEDPTSKPATSPATALASNPADVAKDKEAEAKKEAEEKKQEAPQARVAMQANGGMVVMGVNGPVAASDMPKPLSAPVVADDMFVYGDGKQINCAALKDGRLVWSLLVAGWPTIADGMVFVGSNEGGMDAIDVKTGKLVWHAKDAIATFTRPAVGAGFVCLAGTGNANAAGIVPAGAAVAPAVRIAEIRRGALGMPVVGTHIQSLDSKTGKELWKIPAANCQAVYVAGGLVVWQTNNALTALDAKDGKRVWTRDILYIPDKANVGTVVGEIHMQPLTGLSDSNDLLITDDGIFLVSGTEAIALDTKTGKDIWRNKLDFTYNVSDTEAIKPIWQDHKLLGEGETVYSNDQIDKIRSAVVQLCGQRALMTMSVRGRPRVAVGGNGAPIVNDKTVYVTAVNGIHAFDIKTGQRLWHFRTSSVPNGKLTLADGVLYYGSFTQQPVSTGSPDVIGLNAIKTK